LKFALSTNWNSDRHADGAALVDEILELGFTDIEVGYRFLPMQVPGLEARLAEKAVRVGSVHAFSPVPIEAPRGHPELFLLGALNEDTRRMAIFHLRRTVEFAASLGARVVVLHAGRTPVGRHWHRFMQFKERGVDDGWLYRWHRGRLLSLRERKSARHLAALQRALDELLPVCAANKVALALENLPSLDALPLPSEMLALAEHYQSPWLRYWHDLGHGQIMENLGLYDHEADLKSLIPVLAGVHIHDVGGLMHDHLAPGKGELDFSRFGFLANIDILHVFEPGSGVTAAELGSAISFLNKRWA
jgi:sugar phosphate isomerase/epimerase